MQLHTSKVMLYTIMDQVFLLALCSSLYILLQIVFGSYYFNNSNNLISTSSFLDKYLIAFINNSKSSLKQPSPRLHLLHNKPLIFKVLWQWSIANSLPSSSFLQIAHNLSCFFFKDSYSSNVIVTPSFLNLYFILENCAFSGLSFTHFLRASQTFSLLSFLYLLLYFFNFSFVFL